MQKMITVAEAAKSLNISEQYVRRLLHNGKIEGQQVGKMWVIPIPSFKQLAKIQKNESVLDKANTTAIRKNTITCLSFFSGALGLDLGLEQAGISTRLTSEIDKACRQTIVQNKPGVGLIGDLRDYGKDEILKMAGLGSTDDIDIIAGGPPCQPFSTAGRRKGFDDQRGNVFLHFIDLILELKPKFVIIENVRGLLSAPIQHRPHSQRGGQCPPLAEEELKGGALLYMLQKLRAGGYGVSFNLYNAANFGSPQIRERVVLLCSRDGQKLPYLTPTHSENGQFGLPPWKTLREALEGLELENHTFVKFPEKRLAYYRLLKSGQNWRDLPPELQKEALGDSYFAGGGKTGFLRRLAWDKPAPTLVTHPAMPATDLAHPVEDRPLSIQEYKRIQEFPDDWIFGGNIQEQYRQIGNAVPVSFGRAIGKTIVACLCNEKVFVADNFPYSRYRNTDEKSWEKNVLAGAHKRRTSRHLSLFP